MRLRRWIVATLMVLAPLPALAAEAKQESFGVLPDGRAVSAVTLSNGHNMRVRVISLGAILQSVQAPDRAGKFADLVLGYSDLKAYLGNTSYFGATVGRYANRIAKGRFTLNGHAYQLPINNGVNSLHGGKAGFGEVLWTVT